MRKGREQNADRYKQRNYVGSPLYFMQMRRNSL